MSRVSSTARTTCQTQTGLSAENTSSSVESVNYKDSPSEPIKNAFDTITRVINEELKIGGSVLVHCNMGISRSTSVILAFLMKYRAMPLKAAFDLVREKRSCVNPNIGFWKQLIKYEEIIFHKNTVEFEIGPKGCVPSVFI
ncbi:unnamed protein product [Oikopleura dioica]|uniref:Protein-tyrosine-phosphatase n=1 Tax=Oikopleura dioica TaxID=34765 RepID=E4YWE7_OIKDI|nr:unnamed protein product [Oikopleura dioica]